MKKIVIIGGGVLGSQIAFQSAYCGFDVTIWLRSEGSIQRTKEKLAMVKQEYIDAINLMNTEKGKSFNNWCRGIADVDDFNVDKCLETVEKAFESINLELNLEFAIKDADLIVESMAEDFDAKKDFYKMMAPLVNSNTIVVTNSSTLLPSKLAKFTGCPNRFLALHFANSI